ISEFFYVEIEVFVIKRNLNFSIDNVFEFFHVYHVSSFWINISGNADNEFVIVSVKIRIVAQPKDFLVFFFGPIFAVQSVSGIKMCFSTYGNSHTMIVD